MSLIQHAGRRTLGEGPMTDEAAGSGEGSIYRVAAADYVAELTGELANLARQHGLTTLSFILDMARLEAQHTARHMNGQR